MGYDAYSLETDFTVPGDKVAEALAVLNASLTDDPEAPGGYTSLAEAVDAIGGFEGSDNPDDNVNHNDFVLGYYSGRYHDEHVLAALRPLAPFAKEGSCVRFRGEDDCLFGFRVVDGKLEEETGYVQWRLWKDINAKVTP
jgi:hypothetical protein